MSAPPRDDDRRTGWSDPRAVDHLILHVAGVARPGAALVVARRGAHRHALLRSAEQRSLPLPPWA